MKDPVGTTATVGARHRFSKENKALAGPRESVEV